MNALDLTKDFAARGGYRGNSPAMLAAIEDIRQAGIREARQMHMARLKKCRSLHNPSLFAAAIHPADSVHEAMDDTVKAICAFKNLPTHQRDRQRRRFVALNEKLVTLRYSRRYGEAIWARRAA